MPDKTKQLNIESQIKELDAFMESKFYGSYKTTVRADIKANQRLRDNLLIRSVEDGYEMARLQGIKQQLEAEEFFFEEARKRLEEALQQTLDEQLEFTPTENTERDENENTEQSLEFN